MTDTLPIENNEPNSSLPQSTSDGSSQPTEEKAETSEETQIMLDLLARLKDIFDKWPVKFNGQQPEPFFDQHFMYIAFPIRGHVIKNSVTSDGKQSFSVDGVEMIPPQDVTSEAK